jgi:hypothetical protein
VTGLDSGRDLGDQLRNLGVTESGQQRGHVGGLGQWQQGAGGVVQAAVVADPDPGLPTRRPERAWLQDDFEFPVPQILT